MHARLFSQTLRNIRTKVLCRPYHSINFDSKKNAEKIMKTIDRYTETGLTIGTIGGVTLGTVTGVYGCVADKNPEAILLAPIGGVMGAGIGIVGGMGVGALAAFPRLTAASVIAGLTYEAFSRYHSNRKDEKQNEESTRRPRA